MDGGGGRRGGRHPSPPPVCSGHHTTEEQFLPPLCAPYAIEATNKLSPLDYDVGWRNTKASRTNPVSLRVQVWTDDCFEFGSPHRKGDRLLTWQVIAKQVRARAPRDALGCAGVPS